MDYLILTTPSKYLDFAATRNCINLLTNIFLQSHSHSNASFVLKLRSTYKPTNSLTNSLAHLSPHGAVHVQSTSQINDYKFLTHLSTKTEKKDISAKCKRNGLNSILITVLKQLIATIVNQSPVLRTDPY